MKVSMENLSPISISEKFFGWFDWKKRLVLLTALITGVLTHLLLLVYGFMSPDGLTSSILYSASDYEVAVGRWGIDLIDSIRGNMSVSAVSSIFCLLFASAAAVFLTDLYGFQKKITLFLSAIAVVVFPTVTLTLLYHYCADAYMLSFFLATFAVWCFHKIPNRIVSIVAFLLLEIASLSMYQAYLGIVIGTEVIYAILLLLREEDLKKTVKQEVIYIISSIVGLGLYYGLTKILCKLMAMDLTTYNGFGTFTVGGFLSNLGNSFRSVYGQFFAYMFEDTVVFNSAWHRDTFYTVFLISVIALSVIVILQKKLYKDIVRLILLLGCILIIPLGINIVFLISSDGKLYALNSMSMVLIFFFLFVLIEELEGSKEVLFRWCGVLSAMAILFTYFMTDVYSYVYLKGTYDQAYSVTSRMLERMESTEGYIPGMEIAFTDIIEDKYFERALPYAPYTIDYIISGPIFHSLFLGGKESYRRYFMSYHGETLNFCTDETYVQVVSTEEFEEMGVFPAADSVRIINGICVVKMSEEPAMPIGY